MLYSLEFAVWNVAILVLVFFVKDLCHHGIMTFISFAVWESFSPQVPCNLRKKTPDLINAMFMLRFMPGLCLRSDYVTQEAKWTLKNTLCLVHSFEISLHIHWGYRKLTINPSNWRKVYFRLIFSDLGLVSRKSYKLFGPEKLSLKLQSANPSPIMALGLSYKAVFKIRMKLWHPK